MFSKLMQSLVLALTLVGFIAPTGARAADIPGFGAATAKKFVVTYRKAGDATWTRSKEYPSREAAEVAADVYRSTGLEARVEQVVNAPVAATGAVPTRDAVSYGQAAAVFNWMAAQDDITFGYVLDGCYARTHLMVKRMQAMGLTPGKVWAFQRTNEERLYVIRDGSAVTWVWHNAPTLKVRERNGVVATYVIDPSLFSSPVTVDQWKRAMIRPGATVEPHICETKLGEAPIGANGGRYAGNGYHPGEYPADKADANALEKMREFAAKLRK